MTRLAAVSVDLDEIGCYRAIHGLPVRPDVAAHAVYDVALSRIAAFADELEIPLTVFAIGRDLGRERSAEGLRALARRAGVEVENHSFSHRYDLSLLSRPEIASDVRRGADVIASAVDRRPVGFRAPGYMVSDALFDALEDEAVAFDASVFPSPVYQTAKLGVMAYQHLAGRSSASVVGDAVGMIRAPADPYRPGRPWPRRGTRPIVELPIAVTRGPRLPLIGTSAALAGERGARWLARACAGRPLVSFELHAIDFLDEGDDLHGLAPYQRDLRIPVEDKRRRLAAVVTTLEAHGYRFTTLARAARDLELPSSEG